jgi:DeoR/GlpR family transcriptional regulator of sugar metabolism
MTIRRDLYRLELQGAVIRTFGGALARGRSLASEIPYRAKVLQRQEEKRRIGAAAALAIHDGDTVILDSGSTTLEIARALRGRLLTVVTNDLQIAVELAAQPETTLVVAGGIRQPELFTLLGPETEAFFRQIRVDRTFLSTDGVDLDVGITNRTLGGVPVKQAMIAAARETTVVADSSKFGRPTFARVCPIKAVTRMITDRGLDREMVDRIREMEVVLQLV